MTPRRPAYRAALLLRELLRRDSEGHPQPRPAVELQDLLGLQPRPFRALMQELREAGWVLRSESAPRDRGGRCSDAERLWWAQLPGEPLFVSLPHRPC